MQTKGLTDVAGIMVGHVSDFDALTGCTVVLCEGGAAGGVDVRGSATGSEELDLLNPLHVTDRIHGITLAGGSAFGLEAASGVRRHLERKGVGYQTSAARVPLVPAAIIYDLGIGKPGVRPNREMGEAAAAGASAGPVREGAVGAGTGATVGKLLGMDHAMKSGLGTAAVELAGGIIVAALAVVNAVGDVVDPANGRILSGARVAADSREFANSARVLATGAAHAPLRHQNTTLVVVATNAALRKTGCTKLAQLASAGVARSISPVWTTYDGDIVFALSAGNREGDINALGVAAAQAVSEAILRAVRLAPSIGGLPGLAG